MGLISHTERELALLEKITPDAVILGFKKEIIALAEAFSKSGQSGGSAPYVASSLSKAIKHLLLYKVITPLTGDDEEWVENDQFFQNKRDSAVFKDGKTGQPYFIDAIVFVDENGLAFAGGSVMTKNGEEISSRQYIKSFPFKPKTFYIDVISERWADKDCKIPDKNGAFWTHRVKDKDQLTEVFKYYDKQNKKKVV